MPSLGKLANTSAQQIDRLERGQRKMTRQWADRLAPYLDVPSEVLVYPDKSETGDIMVDDQPEPELDPDSRPWIAFAPEVAEKSHTSVTKMLLAKLWSKSAAAVRDDATALIARFGADDAYGQARQRARDFQRNGPDDSGRPRNHWNRVAVEIAKRTNRRIGIDTATRYLWD